MGTTFYIHIGIHKTGSTSIQQTLFKNREELLARGINYLSIDRNHGPVLISLMSEVPHADPRNIRRYLDTAEKAASYNATNRQIVTELLAENRSPKMVISGEGFSTIPAEDARRLKEMLDPYAAAYRIIVYVRDPYDYANSAALQSLKTGSTIVRAQKRPPLPKHRQKIEKYIEVFGRENVDIRIFDPARFAGGSLISDFAAALGESAQLADSLQIVRANPSMSHEAAMILSEANKAFPPRVGGFANRARAFGFHLVVTGIKGEKFSVDPDAYLKLEAEVAADLAWLHGVVGEPVFARSVPRAASTARWSDATVESIKRMVSAMAVTIRQLQTARRPSIWRSLFRKPRRYVRRLREGKDFSQASSLDLSTIALPAGLEWLCEPLGQPAKPDATIPCFDQATIRSLAVFIHSLALTIERLRTERQAAQQRGFAGRLGLQMPGATAGRAPDIGH